MEKPNYSQCIKIWWPILENHDYSWEVLWDFEIRIPKKTYNYFISKLCNDNWISLNPWFRIIEENNWEISNAEILELSLWITKQSKNKTYQNFKYWDKVIIKKWFYKWISCIIDDYVWEIIRTTDWNEFYTEYSCLIWNNGKTVYINYFDLVD